MNKMENGKRITINTDKKLDFADSSPRGIADFLKKHYHIKMPLQDPEKIQITPIEETLWKYQPKDVLNEILLHFKTEGINISKNDLFMVISSPNYIEPYDPVKEYFDSIRGTYRGISHIDILCQHIIPRVFSDNTPEFYRERTDRLIKKWIVACVACWLGDIPNDVALGLISGRGGIGKTSLTKFLFPKPLKDYYVVASKDERIFNITDAFTRYLFINFEEMEGINKSTINTLKLLMSRDEVESKTYHERIATRKKRLACVLFNTNHNQENNGFIHSYFGDTRRFGCIELEDIDWEEYNEAVDPDQIWAEALNLYEDTDFNYIFDKVNDYPDFIRYNQRYPYESTAMSYIQSWLSKPENENDGVKINSSGILRQLLDSGRIKREHIGPKEKDVNANSIGRALAALGYEPVKYRPSDRDIPLSGWHVKFNE